jgi:hypothetical protein
MTRGQKLAICPWAVLGMLLAPELVNAADLAVAAGNVTATGESAYGLAESGDLKATLVVKSPASLADTDWLKLVITNAGNATNIMFASYSIDKAVTTVIGSGLASPRQAGSLGEGRNFGAPLPVVGKRPPKYFLPAGEWDYVGVPSAFAARALGWPQAEGWQVTAWAKLDVRLAGKRELKTPPDGVEVQLQWVRPSEAEMAVLKQRMTELVAKPERSMAENIWLTAMMAVPELVKTITLSQALAALQAHFAEPGEASFDDPTVRLVMMSWASDPTVTASFQAALAARNPAAVDDVCEYSAGFWSDGFVMPLVAIVEQGPVVPPRQGRGPSDVSVIMTAREKAMDVLDMHAAAWANDPTIPPRLSQAILNANPILTQAATESPTAAGLTWWNWWTAVHLLAETRDPAAVSVLRPYLNMKDVAVDGYMSDNGQPSERVCDVAYTAILKLLNKPAETPDWNQAMATNQLRSHDAYLQAWEKIWAAQDPKIVALEAELAAAKS